MTNIDKYRALEQEYNAIRASLSSKLDEKYPAGEEFFSEETVSAINARDAEVVSILSRMGYEKDDNGIKTPSGEASYPFSRESAIAKIGWQ